MTPDRTVKALEVPRLVVKLADGKEVHHHLAGAESTIGRDPSNKICLTDHFVSKFHAKLVKAGSGPEPHWVLTDLGSANKTYVNGEAITEATVKLGDTIRFASVECRIAPPEVAERAKAAARQAPAPAPAPPPAPAPAVSPPAPSSAAPPVPAPSRPEPQPQRKAPPPAPRASARPQAASAAPRIEADPMKRLLTIGAILILISLVLGIILRILLVPSETPPAEADSRSGSGAETAGSGASTSPDTGATASSSQAAGGPATSAPSVDATGNRTAEFYFEEGLSYLDTGRLKDAQASLRKVIELDPDHTRAKTRLSLLDEEIERQAQLHFDNAREAFQFLRYDEAIAEWEMFLLLADPGDVRYAEAQTGIQQAQSRLR